MISRRARSRADHINSSFDGFPAKSATLKARPKTPAGSQAFAASEMGYASAMGMALFALILVFTLVQWRINRRTELNV